jgi:hypothetical protein
MQKPWRIENLLRMLKPWRIQNLWLMPKPWRLENIGAYRNVAAQEKLDARCFDPSRPTFYRKRTVSQRKRENAGNRWWGPECKLSYLSHMPWINKQ